MRKGVFLLLGLFLFAAGDTYAISKKYVDMGQYGVMRVRGKKGRKYIRRFLLRENLTGDKLRIYQTYGFTPHRLRIRALGRVTEKWTYHSDGLEFTFDDSGNLLSERQFWPQSGHIE